MWDKRERDARDEQLVSNRRDSQQDGELGTCCSELHVFIHNSDIKPLVNAPLRPVNSLITAPTSQLLMLSPNRNLRLNPQKAADPDLNQTQSSSDQQLCSKYNGNVLEFM